MGWTVYLAISWLCTASTSSSESAPTVWVDSYAGSDSNTGLTPETPVATIVQGFVAVKAHNATTMRLAGFHRMSATLSISADDVPAGLVIDAWPGRPAGRLSGGVTISETNWKV